MNFTILVYVLCVSTYELCDSELIKAGSFCQICYVAAYARGINIYRVTIRVKILIKVI